MLASHCRGIGYFIEGILHMCVFAKRPVSGTFTGITNCSTDLSIDILRLSLVPILKVLQGFHVPPQSRLGVVGWEAFVCVADM